jgi:hypothetical protein
MDVLNTAPGPPCPSLDHPPSAFWIAEKCCPLHPGLRHPGIKSVPCSHLESIRQLLWILPQPQTTPYPRPLFPGEDACLFATEHSSFCFPVSRPSLALVLLGHIFYWAKSALNYQHLLCKVQWHSAALFPPEVATL